MSDSSDDLNCWVFLRWVWMKWGCVRRDFHGFDTHRDFPIDFAGNRESMSMMTSCGSKSIIFCCWFDYFWRKLGFNWSFD